MIWRVECRVKNVSMLISAAALAAVLFWAGPVSAAPMSDDLFKQGSMRLGILAGSGSAFDKNYFVFGIGAGYFVRDGIEAGLDAEFWNGTPGITKLSPEVRYVAREMQGVRPYVGIFYRRMFIEGHDDLNSAGGRAGVYVGVGRKASLGAGLAYERVLDCASTNYGACSETYPELQFILTF